MMLAERGRKLPLNTAAATTSDSGTTSEERRPQDDVQERARAILERRSRRSLKALSDISGLTDDDDDDDDSDIRRERTRSSTGTRRTLQDGLSSGSEIEIELKVFDKEVSESSTSEIEISAGVSLDSESSVEIEFDELDDVEAVTAATTTITTTADHDSDGGGVAPESDDELERVRRMMNEQEGEIEWSSDSDTERDETGKEPVGIVAAAEEDEESVAEEYDDEFEIETLSHLSRTDRELDFGHDNDDQPPEASSEYSDDFSECSSRHQRANIVQGRSVRNDGSALHSLHETLEDDDDDDVPQPDYSSKPEQSSERFGQNHRRIQQECRRDRPDEQVGDVREAHRRQPELRTCPLHEKLESYSLLRRMPRTRQRDNIERDHNVRWSKLFEQSATATQTRELRAIIRNLERSQQALGDEMRTLSMYRYTTLQDTKEMLRRSRPPPLSLEQALAIVEQEEQQNF